jgi:type IV fimbrial biogenesis protein FimT
MRYFSLAPARGVTLIELLTVLALLAIVGAIAAPGLSQFMLSQRIRTLALDLSSDMQLARSEALIRNAVVSMTPTAGEWEKGWSITTGATVLMRRQPDSNLLSLSNAPSVITFGVQGRVVVPTDGVRVDVSATGAHAAARRCVELDLSGRARTRNQACVPA